MKKNSLQITVFFCGAATMMLELVGSRVLAPHMGTSILVWTSLIGIILGSLSLGYAWGGRVADKRPDPQLLSKIILAAAIWVSVIAFFSDIVVILVGKVTMDLRLGAVLSTLLLFGLPSVLLGMVSPFAARISNTELRSTGATVGSLYAISTVGSIVGTFLAGFYLVSYLSITMIFIVIACVLVFASLLIGAYQGAVQKTVLMVILILLGMQSRLFAETFLGKDFVDVNTTYNRVWIYDLPRKDPLQSMRVMQINDETSSLNFIYKEGLAAPYARFYRMATVFHPNIKKALMIGAGAYSYPVDFINRNPEAEMDTVEIDPKLTQLAKTYFSLRENPRLHIYHEDARTFINRTQNKYDVVFMDSFKSFSLPFQLTTRECLGGIYSALTDDGIVMANVISSVNGEEGQMLRALVRTFKQFFPHVYVFAVTSPDKPDQVQNNIIVAFKSKARPRLLSTDPELNGYIQNIYIQDIPEDVPVLRDDYAPVDRYLLPVLQYILNTRRDEMKLRIKRRLYAV